MPAGRHLSPAGRASGTVRRLLPGTVRAVRARLARRRRRPRRRSGQIGDLTGVLVGTRRLLRAGRRIGPIRFRPRRGFGSRGLIRSRGLIGSQDWLRTRRGLRSRGRLRWIRPPRRIGLRLRRGRRPTGQEPVQPVVDAGRLARCAAVAAPRSVRSRGCIRSSPPSPLPGRDVGRVGDPLRTRTGTVPTPLGRAGVPGLVR